MSKIAIFVGPKKTGTSWLYNVAFSDTSYKEMRYPARIGRSFIYRKYVSGQNLLVWPYLLHDRKSLEALLQDLERNGQAFELYVSIRDQAKWKSSMKKFAEKYGMSALDAEQEVNSEAAKVEANIAYLESKYTLNKLQIIQPEDADLDAMSIATGIDRQKLVAEKDTRVYETSETSRLSSSFIVELFFRVKPFLPTSLQTITRNQFLRKLFFRADSNVS